jgi:hypothetical protein
MYPQYNDNMINKNIFKKKDVEWIEIYQICLNP